MWENIFLYSSPTVPESEHSQKLKEWTTPHPLWLVMFVLLCHRTAGRQTQDCFAWWLVDKDIPERHNKLEQCILSSGWLHRRKAKRLHKECLAWESERTTTSPFSERIRKKKENKRAETQVQSSFTLNILFQSALVLKSPAQTAHPLLLLFVLHTSFVDACVLCTDLLDTSMEQDFFCTLLWKGPFCSLHALS